MKIRTKDGIGEALPLTDIQMNNRIINFLAWILLLFFIYLIWLTWYIIHYGVVNNIVARCL